MQEEGGKEMGMKSPEQRVATKLKRGNEVRKDDEMWVFEKIFSAIRAAEGKFFERKHFVSRKKQD